MANPLGALVGPWRVLRGARVAFMGIILACGAHRKRTAANTASMEASTERMKSIAPPSGTCVPELSWAMLRARGWVGIVGLDVGGGGLWLPGGLCCVRFACF